jgi:ParB family transcriptional regulator, chromosome partitioning protein
MTRARVRKTVAQEASAIFRRKAIYEELHPETKAGVAQSIGMNKAIGRDVTDNLSATFASATADARGKDERTIRRAAARGEALGDDLGAVTGTSLDKGMELDALEPVKRRPVSEHSPAATSC